jgi:hypothetical protein
MPGAQEWTSVRSLKHVNLNAPEALERLAAENPAHHAKIHRIMAGLRHQHPESVAAWLRTSFGAKHVSSALFYRMSLPAKRDIAFVLDSTLYRGRLTGGEFLPVHSP